MGYTTEFTGKLKLNPPASADQVEYINNFSSSRRMRRDVAKLMEMFGGKHGLPDLVHPDEVKEITKELENVGYEVTGLRRKGKDNRTPEEIYGVEGEYFANPGNDMGQDRNDSVLDYNQPPKTQPGLWCKWEIDSYSLYWNGVEKFYDYVEWLQYLIDNFFGPWGIKLSGELEWNGEERGDIGKIIVEDNVVTVKEGSITYE